MPIHETFECDLPGTENVEDNAAAPLVHYNDSLGAWLHDELSRLRNKKGAKAAKERQQFQELVDQGKLNQFDLDAEVQKETTHRESAAVRTSSAGEISNGEPKSKRVTIHIDWNLCYQALLHYKRYVALTSCEVIQPFNREIYLMLANTGIVTSIRR